MITHYQGLRYLDRFKNSNQRLTKWAIELGNYEFEVICKKAKENLVADALSIAPIEQVYGDQDYKKSMKILTKSEVQKYQAKFSGKKRKHCDEIKGILVKRNYERIRLVVSEEEMERELIKRIHTGHCHRGVATMLNVIRRAWAVKELRKKLQEYRNQCKTCVKNRLLLNKTLEY